MSLLFFIFLFGQQVTYHDIYIDDPIVSKYYIYQRFSDGNAMEVPIINGLFPDITERIQGPLVHRIFDYRRKVPYQILKPKPPKIPEKKYTLPMRWIEKNDYMKSPVKVPDLGRRVLK